MTVTPPTKSLTVYILTGATGRTCDEVLRAALAQFDEPSVRIVRRTKLHSEADVVREVRAAAEAGPSSVTAWSCRNSARRWSARRPGCGCPPSTSWGR